MIFKILTSTITYVFMLTGTLLLATLFQPDLVGVVSKPIQKTIIRVQPSDTIFTLSHQVFKDNLIQRRLFEYRYLIKSSSYRLKTGEYQIEDGESFAHVLGYIGGE